MKKIEKGPKGEVRNSVAGLGVIPLCVVVVDAASGQDTLLGEV